MKRFRLVAYFVYIYTVPEAYKIEGGFLIPRAVHNRIVRFEHEDLVEIPVRYDYHGL